MVGKLCAGPKRGGSAGGLAAYLVGYAITGKGASREEIEAALDSVYAEAEARHDLGVGRVWSPEAGHGTRPSSILVRNCSSFSTASLEMDADGAANGAVKHAALHFVWSFSTAESDTMTDEQAHKYVGEVVDKLGLGHHRQQLVVHRDTIVRDGGGKIVDGNLHVHGAIGTIDPANGVAYPTVGIYKKMAWAEREVERANGLEYDRGLAVVADVGKATEHVRWAEPEELAAWGRERREERLVAMERRSFEGYRQRDQDFGRYADVTVAPRLRAAVDLARRRGRDPDWATLHGVAARYGCALEAEDDGKVYLRDVGTGELRLTHDKARREIRKAMTVAGAEPEQIDIRLTTMKAEHAKAEAAERDRKIRQGDTVALDVVLRDECEDMPAFQTIEQSELAIIAQIEQHPEIVLRDITAQSSTFDRSDIHGWLESRISDPDAMERLGDLIVSDDSVRALEIDTEHALLTTTEILDIEGQLHEDARGLALRPSGISQTDVDRAVRTFEKEASTPKQSFRLTDEQRAALRSLKCGSLTAVEGLPGTGKTTIMSAVRVLAEQQGREIIGLTLSQAAAERLESEAGFRVVNTSRARIMEASGSEVIPRNGIVVVDEAGMVDSRAFQRIVEAARERNAHVLAIGDRRQLQPIDAGAAWRIITDDAREIGAYSELRDIQRQHRKWHKMAVTELADAIVEKDDAKRLALVKNALKRLDDNGALTWTENRDSAINTAVTKARAYRAAGLADTIMPAADKDTVRHLAEEDRRRAGLAGTGRSYVTEGGRRELAIGDRFLFLENSLGKRGLGVRNGDAGEVVDATAYRISVRLDGADGKVITFSPRSYRSWDYGASTSVHKTQGASVSACAPVIDRAASAELVFVAASRSKTALDLVIPKTAFADLDELAEHVASRISLKTTTCTYDELLERTGGKETMRVRKMEQQREAVDSPLRREWQSEVVELLRKQRADQMLEAREAHMIRKTEIADVNTRSLSEQLELRRNATRDFRKAIAAIHAATKTPTFLGWMKDHERDVERTHERARDHQQHRNNGSLTSRTVSIKNLDPQHRDMEISYEHTR